MNRGNSCSDCHYFGKSGSLPIGIGGVKMSNILYHYTDKDARDGICDNNELWFKLTSKSRNDTRDTTYIREVLKIAAEKYQDNNYFYRQAFKVMNSVLNPVAPEHLRCYIEQNIFMFCTMKIQNDQYGREFYNKDTDVFRIEFDKYALIEYFKNQMPLIDDYGLFLFGDMIYDETEQLDKIMEIIKRYENDYKSFNNNRFYDPVFLNTSIIAATPCNDYSGISGYQPSIDGLGNWCLKSWENMEYNEKFFLNKLWISLANDFYKISTFIKDPAYEEKESEYRIAFYGKHFFEKYKPKNEFDCVKFPICKQIILKDTII